MSEAKKIIFCIFEAKEAVGSSWLMEPLRRLRSSDSLPTHLVGFRNVLQLTLTDVIVTSSRIKESGLVAEYALY